eukprot:13552749-Alexandrium_andersonii.AAC.1
MADGYPVLGAGQRGSPNMAFKTASLQINIRGARSYALPLRRARRALHLSARAAWGNVAHARTRARKNH